MQEGSEKDTLRSKHSSQINTKTPRLIHILCKYQFDGRLSRKQKKVLVETHFNMWDEQVPDRVSFIRCCDEGYKLYDLKIKNDAVNALYQETLNIYDSGNTVRYLDYLSNGFAEISHIIANRQLTMLLSLARSGYDLVKNAISTFLRCGMLGIEDIDEIKKIIDVNNEVDLFISGKIAFYNKDYQTSVREFDNLLKLYGNKVPVEVIGAFASAVLAKMNSSEFSLLESTRIKKDSLFLLTLLEFASDNGCFFSTRDLMWHYRLGYSVCGMQIIKQNPNHANLLLKKGFLQGDIFGGNSSLGLLISDTSVVMKEAIPEMNNPSFSFASLPTLFNSLSEEKFNNINSRLERQLNTPESKEFQILESISQLYHTREYISQEDLEAQEKFLKGLDDFSEESETSLQFPL